MKIEILGDGCSKCKSLKNRVQQAVDQLGIQAEIHSVMDPERIAELQALSLPQLVINGHTVPSNRLATVDGIQELLRNSKS